MKLHASCIIEISSSHYQLAFSTLTVEVVGVAGENVTVCAAQVTVNAPNTPRKVCQKVEFDTAGKKMAHFTGEAYNEGQPQIEIVL